MSAVNNNLVHHYTNNVFSLKKTNKFLVNKCVKPALERKTEHPSVMYNKVTELL